MVVLNFTFVCSLVLFLCNSLGAVGWLFCIGSSFIQKTLSKEDNYCLNMFDKLQQEKLHLKFCKYILGISSKATDLAVCGETGRCPILIQILTNMFNNLIHLKTLKTLS